MRWSSIAFSDWRKPEHIAFVKEKTAAYLAQQVGDYVLRIYSEHNQSRS